MYGFWGCRRLMWYALHFDPLSALQIGVPSYRLLRAGRFEFRYFWFSSSVYFLSPSQSPFLHWMSFGWRNHCFLIKTQQHKMSFIEFLKMLLNAFFSITWPAGIYFRLNKHHRSLNVFPPSVLRIFILYNRHSSLFDTWFGLRFCLLKKLSLTLGFQVQSANIMMNLGPNCCQAPTNQTTTAIFCQHFEKVTKFRNSDPAQSHSTGLPHPRRIFLHPMA